MITSKHNSRSGQGGQAYDTNVPTLIYHPEIGDIDLVFILDSICSDKLFKSRQTYLKNLLNAVKANLLPGGRLRIGAIAYRGSKRSSKDPASFEAYTLSDDLDDVMNFLKAKRPSEGRNFEAAFEDALEALYRFGWERASRRFVVTVGNRPPHPLTREPHCVGQLGSPVKYDWRVLLTGLRSYYRINFISVVCSVYWPADNLPEYAEGYANDCWKEIGYSGTFKFKPANYTTVAGMITSATCGSLLSSPGEQSYV